MLLADYLKHHELPLPPPPPPGFVEVSFYVSIDLAGAPGRGEAAPRAPPVVTSHFPASGALVAAKRPRVIFELSEPLRATSLEADAVIVLGEASGLVPGQVSADAERWWVVWEPRADLARGDTFHVTLAKGGIEGAGGSALPDATTFTFRSAR